VYILTLLAKMIDLTIFKNASNTVSSNKVLDSIITPFKDQEGIFVNFVNSWIRKKQEKF